MTLWDQCEGEKHIISLGKKPWRIVEAQHMGPGLAIIMSLLYGMARKN